jgi:hypothetical protein
MPEPLLHNFRRQRQPALNLLIDVPGCLEIAQGVQPGVLRPHDRIAILVLRGHGDAGRDRQGVTPRLMMFECSSMVPLLFGNTRSSLPFFKRASIREAS